MQKENVLDGSWALSDSSTFCFRVFAFYCVYNVSELHGNINQSKHMQPHCHQSIRNHVSPNFQVHKTSCGESSTNLTKYYSKSTSRRFEFCSDNCSFEIKDPFSIIYCKHYLRLQAPEKLWLSHHNSLLQSF